MNNRIVYSKSRIETFKKCKKQYELKYIKNIEIEQKETEDILFGKWIHKVLEFYNPDTDNKLEVVKFASEYDIRGLDYRNAMPSTLKNAVAFTKLYWKYVRKTEEDVEYIDDGLAVKGVIDLRMEQKDGMLVVDYKSSKNPNKARHEYQMKMYCLILSKNYQLKPEDIRILIYYPRIDMYDRFNFTSMDIQIFEKELKQDISDIEGNKKFEPNAGYHCRWCPFLDTQYCIQGKHV